MIIAASLAALMLAADSPLYGSRWYLATLDGSAFTLPAGTRRLTLEFDNEGNFKGFAGVNTFRGAFTVSTNGDLNVGPVASTRMAGSEAAMRLEAAYLRSLSRTDRFQLADNRLTLWHGEANVAGFTRITDATDYVSLNPVGVDWRAVSVSNLRFPTNASEAAYLHLNDDRSVSGFGGINRISGTYTLRDRAIDIQATASLRNSGSTSRQQREFRFLQALQVADNWKLEGRQLVLFTGQRPVIRFERK